MYASFAYVVPYLGVQSDDQMPCRRLADYQVLMNSDWKYLSIVKGREGEYRGLVDLDEAVLANITPLIALWPGEPGENESDPVSGGFWPSDEGTKVAGSLSDVLLSKIRARWPVGHPLLLDGKWLKDPASFGTVIETARAAGFLPLPVTGLDRADAYQDVVAQASRLDRQGTVLRLGRSDFAAHGNLIVRIPELLERLGLTPADTDLVIDLGELERLRWESDEITLEAMCELALRLGDWRNFAVAGSSQPRGGGKFVDDGIEPFPRLEWWIFQKAQLRGRISRQPVFGDYGTSHPELVEGRAGRNIPIIPTLRYTTVDGCLMVRGLNTKTAGWEHLMPLCQKLMERPEWCQGSFSEGDHWIERVANGEPLKGNYTTWKEVSQAHHLTFVSRQLANQNAA